MRRGDSRREREMILGLWSVSFAPVEQLPEKYDLFHLQNPAGASQIYFLDHVDSSTSVGVMCIALRRCKSGKEYINAGIIADLVVSPDHRSLGPAVKLHNESLALALKDLDLVYGFPNSHSVTLTKFAKFQFVDSISRYAKPIRFSSYLRNRFPALLALPAALILNSSSSLSAYFRSLPLFRCWKAETFSAFDARFDRLWETAVTPDLIIGQRDASFLNWRFTLNKTRDYRVFGITSKKTGELGGYIAYAVDHSGFVTIADFLALDTHKTLRALFLLFECEMRRNRRKAISLTFHGCKSVIKNFEKLGFNRRESNPLCCKWSPRLAALMGGKEWYFTSADNDV